MGMFLERGEIQEIYERLSIEPGDGLVMKMGMPPGLLGWLAETIGGAISEMR